MSISGSSFNLKELNENSYELIIKFKKKNAGYIERKFTFLQNPSVDEGTIFDVFTKNGLCQNSLLQNLFKEEEVKELEQANGALKECEFYNPVSPLVAVLDLKDVHKGYLPCNACQESIEACEETVCAFFQHKAPFQPASNHAKRIHEIFTNSLSLDFIICEGSLKKDLLSKGTFSDAEIEYFNSLKGKVKFCQCAEFFMNGFKLGQSVQSPDHAYEFKGEKYIQLISTTNQAFQPFDKSCTLYPPLYKKIYAPSSPFVKTLGAVFDVSGDYKESTEFTFLNVNKKRIK